MGNGWNAKQLVKRLYTHCIHGHSKIKTRKERSGLFSEVHEGYLILPAEVAILACMGYAALSLGNDRSLLN